MGEQNKLDLEAEALTALENPLAIPHGRERTEALKKAGMLQNDAVAQGIAFAKRGRPAKT
jgi:mannitol/fructose-specific phosphotransferase system IIA component